MIFSYRRLHSFLLPPVPQERKTGNSLLVAKHIIGGEQRFQDSGGSSIKMGGGGFLGFQKRMLIIKLDNKKDNQKLEAVTPGHRCNVKACKRLLNVLCTFSLCAQRVDLEKY